MITPNKRLLFFVLLAASLLLSGCPHTSTTIIKGPKETQPKLTKIERLLNLAQTSHSPKAEFYRLQAIEILIEQGDYAKAQQQHNLINPNQLLGETRIKYRLIEAKLAQHRNDSQTILDALEKLPANLIEQQPITVQTEISQLRSQAYFLQRQYLKSIKELLYIAPLLSDAQLESNHTLLWQSLLALPETEIRYLLSGQEADTDLNLQGWLELALVGKNNQSNLEQQIIQLNSWLDKWPTHPAAIRLPADLNLLQTIADNRPQKIALLLPTDGPFATAGKAIHDGFFAAAEQSPHTSQPEFMVIDTSGTNDFVAVYDQAVNQGADMIIGPLSKNGVNQIAALGNIPVPTLALNYSSNSAYNPPQLYQFGLSADDEAQQIAQLAWQDGHQYSAVFAPDSAWGKRTAQAFIDQWLALGGKISTQEFYPVQTREFSKTVTSLLNIEASKNRAKTIRQTINRKIEFVPSTRQDIDFIFLLATPQQARQILPTLTYYYAKNIPIYGTSHLYSGTANPSKDFDLNGIKFCDLPWVIDYYNPLKEALILHPDYNHKLTRLYALGIDSYYLYQRLPLLENSPYSQYHGVTGALSLDEQGKIKRSLMNLVIKEGEVQELAPIIENDVVTE